MPMARATGYYRSINRPFTPELSATLTDWYRARTFASPDKAGGRLHQAVVPDLYRQILQNEAGREHRQLAAMYSFTGGGGRLKHIERIITSILQRATTFFDLKRMIVSSDAAAPLAACRLNGSILLMPES